MYARQAGERNGAVHGEVARRARGPSSAFRALRHPAFRLFAAGQVVSLVGTWMQSVAQAWLVWRLTGSSLLLGLVGFAGQAPVLLLGPIGGVAADRLSRRRILIATQTASMLLAFALAALTGLGVARIGHVFVLAGALGAVNAFDTPTRQAFVVELVGHDDLPNAIALGSSMVHAARVLGPALAGVLVGAFGEAWCFLVNGVSFLAVIASLVAMRIRRAAHAPPEGSTLEHVAEGFRFVVKARPVRAVLLLCGLVSLGAMPYSVLMPAIAAEILHVGATGLGALMGASGLGALLGAALLLRRRDVRGLGRWVALAAAGGGVSLAAFSVSRAFWLSLLLLVPVGMLTMVSLAGTNTLVQAMVPDQLRGRVMAVYTMTFLGMAPIGALLAGALSSRIGAPLTVALGGAACLLGALSFAVRLPALRPSARAMLEARVRERGRI